jgi:hypothetical protein
MDNSKVGAGLQNTAHQYEFAELSASEIEEVNKIQNKLNQNQQKEIILLAYEKK